MAIKSEIYPITLKLNLDSALKIDLADVSIDLENSEIRIFNDRGVDLSNEGDHSRLFVDNVNLIIGYLWDTDDTRFNIQDYYVFEFLVAVNYTPSPEPFKLLYTVNRFLESSNRRLQ